MITKFKTEAKMILKKIFSSQRVIPFLETQWKTLEDIEILDL